MVSHLLECKALDIVPQGRTRKPVVAKLTTLMLSLESCGSNPCIHPGSENCIKKFRGNLRFVEDFLVFANTGSNVFHFLAFMHIKKSKAKI